LIQLPASFVRFLESDQKSVRGQCYGHLEHSVVVFGSGRSARR